MRAPNLLLASPQRPRLGPMKQGKVKFLTEIHSGVVQKLELNSKELFLMPNNLVPEWAHIGIGILVIGINSINNFCFVCSIIG